MTNNTKKELKLSRAYSMLSNLNDNNIEDAAAYIERLLSSQQCGVAFSSTITVEHGAIQEMDVTLQNIEFLIDQLDRFTVEGGGSLTFADRDVCATCRMLMDNGEQLREQFAELIDRI